MWGRELFRTSILQFFFISLQPFVKYFHFESFIIVKVPACFLLLLFCLGTTEKKCLSSC